MNHAMDLESALAEIKRLREENQRLREEIEYRDNDENDMCNIIREMKDEINELKQRVENIENNTQEFDDVVYPETDNEEDAEWFDVNVDSEYEIYNCFPYQIRRKSNGKIIK